MDLEQIAAIKADPDAFYISEEFDGKEDVPSVDALVKFPSSELPSCHKCSQERKLARRETLSFKTHHRLPMFDLVSQYHRRKHHTPGPD